MRILPIAFALLAVSCTSRPPTQPSDPPSPTPVATTPVATTPGLTIRSGWDSAPIAGAVVKMGEVQGTTDAAGRVFESAQLGLALDVDAPGFLPRRTTVPGSGQITLWPAATEFEARAIRSMIYEPTFRGEGVHYVSGDPFTISLLSYEGVDSAEVFQAWTTEAATFGEMFGRKYRITETWQIDINEISVLFKPRGTSCATAQMRGFCWQRPPYVEVRVDSQSATDPNVIRAVLASWYLGPNPLPGLMNAAAPAERLSLLEMQAIRMSLLRRENNRYPDTDR